MTSQQPPTPQRPVRRRDLRTENVIRTPQTSDTSSLWVQNTSPKDSNLLADSTNSTQPFSVYVPASTEPTSISTQATNNLSQTTQANFTPGRQESPPANKTKNTKHSSSRLLGPLVLILVLGLVVLGGWFSISYVYNEFFSNDYTGEGKAQVTIEIPNGASGSQMADILFKAKVIKSTEAFIEAFNQNPNATSISPGVYKLKQQMSAKIAISALLDKNTKVEKGILIPPNFTVKQIKARLEKELGISAQEVELAFKNLKLPADAKGNPEGWLAPATYPAVPGKNPTELLQQMVDLQVKNLKDLKVPENKWEYILTIASIAQAEVNHKGEYGKVVRVLENRMANPKVTNGILQVCSTITYGLEKPGLEITTADYQSTNKYNTYLYPGLPPSPIGSPSIEVIKEAINPPPGKWYYFATINIDTGETIFSETYAEQEKAVAKLRQWEKENGH